MANEILEREIASLEEKLKEKRAALGHNERGPEAITNDKEIIRDIITDQIQDVTLKAPIEPSAGPAVPPIQNIPTPDSSADPVAGHVQVLVQIALGKGIKEAIEAAVQTNNPALIDAFHDTLVDQLYDELVARKKVEQP